MADSRMTNEPNLAENVQRMKLAKMILETCALGGDLEMALFCSVVSGEELSADIVALVGSKADLRCAKAEKMVCDAAKLGERAAKVDQLHKELVKFRGDSGSGSMKREDYCGCGDKLDREELSEGRCGRCATP